MASTFCLSVTFLDPGVPTFHGRADGGEPEWPPSPLRLFQALLAASAARSGGHIDDRVAAAFSWLQRQQPPVIVAPAALVGTPIRIAVPNNDLDVVASGWAQRRPSKKQPSELKTMKNVRPTHLRGSDSVHYLYPLLGDDAGHVETLCDAARCLTHLGWGVDLVAGHARVVGDGTADDPRQANNFEVWNPIDDQSAVGLRVPVAGTLDALASRHRAFLNRLEGRAFSPVAALTAFAVVGYRKATDPAEKPFVAFDVWRPLNELARLVAGQSRHRPFDVVRCSLVVAGMVRRAVARAAADARRQQSWINTFVHGHTVDGTAQARGNGADRRLAFLPLPSLERRGESGEHVGMIRRVLVCVPREDARETLWLRQALSGRELMAEGKDEPVATMSLLPDSDRNVCPYVTAARVWSTVTPVVLPGRYTNGPGRARRLLREAFRQAGWPSELIKGAELEWGEVGYRAGTEPAQRYRTAETQSGLPRWHVRVSWPVAVRGPLAIGAGRYRGLGLFAREEAGQFV